MVLSVGFLIIAIISQLAGLTKISLSFGILRNGWRKK
jgi:hypothetical protein